MNDAIDIASLISAPDFSGKVALVSGAGKGLGRACSLALAAAGARVVGVARTEEDLKELQSHNPDNISYWVQDVLNEEFYSKIENMKQLDILVGCAGANKPQPISEITPDTIDWLINLNIRVLIDKII